MIETREIRLKRLRIRCWRRGTKEMDLLLGGFADGAAELGGLASLEDGALDAFEAMLEENDNDLYLWTSGADQAPDRHAAILKSVQRFHGIDC